VAKLEASERLMELVFEAVNEGLEMLKVGALWPFVLSLTKGGLVLQRFNESSISASIQRAQQTLQTADRDTLAYALVYDATITVEENQSDAIMIEAGERGKAYGLRFAQRYRPARALQPVQPIDKLALLGEAGQYLQYLK